eukprot:SAG31_NODE_918_length_11020_cov_14.801392_1_plen_980_part_00
MAAILHTPNKKRAVLKILWLGGVLASFVGIVNAQTEPLESCPWAPWNNIRVRTGISDYTCGRWSSDICDADFDPGRCVGLSTDFCNCCSYNCLMVEPGIDSVQSRPSSSGYEDRLQQFPQRYWGENGPSANIASSCGRCGANSGGTGCQYPGTFGDPPNGQRCAACPAGQFSAGGQPTTACSPCANGRVSPMGSAYCSPSCGEGTFAAADSACELCPAGRYVEVAGSDQASDCIGCEAGRYVEVAGSDQASDCIGCEAGRYVEVAGSDQASDCIGCEAGRYVEVAGSDCIDCPVGKHTLTLDSAHGGPDQATFQDGPTDCRLLWTAQDVSETTEPLQPFHGHCSFSECVPLTCDDSARTLVPNSSNVYYTNGLIQLQGSRFNHANRQAACCIPRCADVADPINTPCTCAQSQYQDNDQYQIEPFSGACVDCPQGLVAPPFSTSADDCGAVATACGDLDTLDSGLCGCTAGRYLLDTLGRCIECLTPTRCKESSTAQAHYSREGGDSRCEDGSTGRACSTCVLTAEARYYALNGDCVKCPDDPGLATVALSLLAIAGFLVVLHHLTAIKPEADEGAAKVLGSLASIALTHFQSSVLIFSIPSVPWPLWIGKLTQYLRNLAFFSFADFTMPECQAHVDDPVTMFLGKFFLKQLLFAVLFGVFVVIFVVGALVSKKRLQHHAVNSMIALYSVAFMMLVRSNAAILACSEQSSSEAACSDPAYTTERECLSGASIYDLSQCGAEWTPSQPGFTGLDEFPDLPCYEGVWLGVAAFAVVSLLMYMLLIPMYLLRKLRVGKRSGTLVDPDNKAKFGWLFLRYKYHVCEYYEFVGMARKAALVLVGMLFGEGYWAVFLTASVLLGTLALHVAFKPYGDHELNHSDEDSHDRQHWTDADKLDALSMVAEVVALVCGVYFIANGNDGPGFVDYTVAIVALACACVPLGLAAYVAIADRKQNAAQIESPDGDVGKQVTANPTAQKDKETE